MKNIWKGLIGFGILLLGIALWITGSIFEGIAGGLAGRSFLLTRVVVGIGFILIFLGPIFFWVILPLRDRLYKSHPKWFIAIITPFVLLILLIFGVIISIVFQEPQLPTYSFQTKLEEDKVTIYIFCISEGDLPDHLNLKLTGPDREEIDFYYVSGQDLKDGEEMVDLNLSYFETPKIGNYTLIIKNVRDEIIYQEEIEVVPSKETPSQVSAESKIVINSYNISIGDVGVDKLYLDKAEVLLRNEGDASATEIELVISSNEEKIEGYPSTTLEPGEEKKVSYSFDWISGELSKGIGVEEMAVTIRLFGYPERRGFEKVEKQILVEKNITIPIPRVRIGDTIPEVKDKHNLSLTLLSWRESDIAVVGPYSGDEYYTFTAKPGMKFVILIFKFQNNWIRVQQTPYLNAGEIATNKGYIYNMWDPPVGIHSEEYKPRKSTDEEVKTLIGNSGGYEDLLPEESTIGCVVFEIPEDEISIEASIVYVPSLIKYEGELK